MPEALSTVTTPPAMLPPSGGAPSGLMPPEPPRRGLWIAKRFLLATVGIIVLAGAATYILVLNEVSSVVSALGQNKAVKLAPNVLAPTNGGAPETLLLVGNDQRPPPKNNPSGFVVPHSNEMLLVRIDPSKPTISMLSIPRELQVTIYPQNGPPTVTRINAAYTIGGIQLMTETIKRIVGISVNHVFVVTFPKFKRAVDEMGCVYMTVDRRYYHVNEPGGEQYFEINLQPGYQRLCGKQALEFVANRHEDTSLTRDARDQRFLLEVKAQYGSTLFEDREKFERIFGRAIETDLHGTGQVLDLLRLLVQSQGKPVRQVPFQVNLLPTYDTATPQQIHESVRSFLDGTAPIPKRRITHSLHTVSHSHHHATAELSLVPTQESDLAHARGVASQLPFALEYPRVRSAYAGAVPDTLRVYDIRDEQGHLHPIYTVVIDRGLLGAFYDIQGTTWTEPPLLSNPSQTVHIGSRTYGLVYEGEQIKTIAWREGSAVYWIENTLTNSVPPREMLAMAEQTLPVTRPTAPARAATPSSSSFNPPPRASATTSSFSKLAAVLDFVSLAGVALLALGVFLRQRELNLLRERVAHAMDLEARLRPQLAVAAGGIPRPERAPPTIYRTPKGRRRGVLVAGAVPIMGILLALAFRFLPAELSSSSARGGSSVPVAVFNASGTPGEAHRIADTLKADRVRLGEIGNINASLGHGVYVLYPPGVQTQARAVARLIPSFSPTIAPIQPQVQNAVGQHNEIVVIFD
jgi:polyisoprenyl-teichoic acid--peptidoglycan teichoic acid transferase